MAATKEKIIKYFFTKLYNGGNFVELTVPFYRIKQLDKIYKNFYDKYSTIEQFELGQESFFADIKKSKSAYQEIKKQFELRRALQSCILTECFVAQTIANILNLTEIVDLKTSKTTPTKLAGLLYSAQKHSDGASFRYCYYNNQYSSIVLQCGASQTVDVVFLREKICIRIEIKEQHAKLEECDITGNYNEEGVLTATKDFMAGRAKYVPFIKQFNQTTNIFRMEGHNYKIENHLTEAQAREIINEVLDIKEIDIYLLIVDNKIIPVLSEYLYEFVSFEGSEIGTAGSNSKKVFTPIFAKKKIIDAGGLIEETGMVIMPFDPTLRIKKKGGNQYSRYPIGSLLFVELKNATIADGFISFEFEKIKQKVPTISIHLNSKMNQNSMAEQTKKLYL